MFTENAKKFILDQHESGKKYRISAEIEEELGEYYLEMLNYSIDGNTLKITLDPTYSELEFWRSEFTQIILFRENDPYLLISPDTYALAEQWFERTYSGTRMPNDEPPLAYEERKTLYEAFREAVYQDLKYNGITVVGMMVPTAVYGEESFIVQVKEIEIELN